MIKVREEPVELIGVGIPVSKERHLKSNPNENG
jgi:hypothetical protein